MLPALELWRSVPAASAKGKPRRALGRGHRDAPRQDPRSASDPSVFPSGMGPSRLSPCLDNSPHHRVLLGSVWQPRSWAGGEAWRTQTSRRKMGKKKIKSGFFFSFWT